MAQSATTGALAGVVLNADGMFLAGAGVTLVNQANNQTQATVADAMGAYRFGLLAPGSYELRFAHDGFKGARLVPVVVSVSEAPSVEARLEPGAASETVACACRVDRSSSSSGTVMDEKTITSVPLNTRNLTQVLSISAGSAADVQNAGNLGRNNQTVNVNGNTTAGSLTVDGAVAPSAVPNPDTISEVKIDTSQYDAGFGAQVPATNLVIRSGTNRVHGVAWEFLRNDIFNANSFFRNATRQPKPNLKQNQFGGTLGGPIRRDKLFFFGSFQGTRQTNGLDPTSTSTSVLPALTADRSAATIAAAFCPGNHAGDARYQTFAGGRQLDCNNQATSTTAPINPIALRILQAKLPDGTFTLPVPQAIIGSGVNAGLGFSSYSVPSTYRENQFLISSDYVVNDKHTLMGRFFYAKIYQYRSFGAPGGVNNGPAIISGSGVPQVLDGKDKMGVVKLNSALSRTLANEFRLGMTRNYSDAYSDKPQSISTIGMTPVNSLLPQLPEIGVLGPLGAFRLFSNNLNDFLNDTRTDVLADNVSWTRAKHTLRTGGVFWKQFNGRNDTSAARGRVIFQSFADFLVGLSAAENLSPSGRSNIQTIAANAGVGPQGEVQYQYRRNYGAVYAQDDFRVSQRVTLNFGLRWEYIGPARDTAGTLGGVVPELLARVPVPPVAGTLVGNTLAANYDPQLVNPYTGQPFGGPPAGVVIRAQKSLYQNRTPRDAFSPRFGFAWQPGTSKRASVRGGYGWFYQSPVYSGNAAGAPLFTSAPFAQSFTNTDSSNNTSTFQKPFPTVTLGYVPRTPASQLSDRVAGPEYRLAQLQQWNLNVQYALTKSFSLDAGYVGSRGTRLLLARGLNQPLLASTARPVNCGYTGNPADCATNNTSLNARLRVPIMGENPNALTASEYQGNSAYHGLQTTLRKALSNGLSFQLGYTLSKSLNDTTVFNDQRTRANSWARANFDRRHRVTGNFSYQLPRLNYTGLANKAINGWSLTGLVVMQSGQPITFTDPFAGGVYGRAATSTVTLCPGATHGSLVTAGQLHERLGGYVNTSAICSAAVVGDDRNATGYGTLGQSVMPGPGQVNTDFSLGKAGRVGGLSEDAQLAFRAEFYNALNQAQFSNPGTTLGTATFGVITQTSVAPRIIQFALKYSF